MNMIEDILAASGGGAPISPTAIKFEPPSWHQMSLTDCIKMYMQALAAASNDEEQRQVRRMLVKKDLFYFLAFESSIGQRMLHPWLYARCREVQANPNGYLDLWAREHYKSTIITFGLTMVDIINDVEQSNGIFSHTRPSAKQFLKQIKNEAETNKKLVDLFPEIFYDRPKSQSPKWSEDEGIVFKRVGNPKEATVEAWGVVDGQPTGKHFDRLLFDDLVTLESVSTPDQIKKTTEALQMADNLGKEGGIKRFIGTRYHLFDTYADLISRGSLIPRVYPCAPVSANKNVDFEKSVLMRPETLRAKYIDQGSITFSTQMLLDPLADKAMGFPRDKIKYFDMVKSRMLNATNRYILVDPASGRKGSAGTGKKVSNDYTAMWVIGLGADGRYYILDGIHDRLNLFQRINALIHLHKIWSTIENPIQGVGYEEYGLQADIEYLGLRQKELVYTFNVTPLGGKVAKEDRIKKLLPMFESEKIWLPRYLHSVNTAGESVDIVKSFVENEYNAFPVCKHDDQLDCMARILDPAMNTVFPQAMEQMLIDQEDIWAGTGYQNQASRKMDWMTS